MRLAYLVSRYPAVSHTFILREVLALRRLGFELEVASINAPDRPESGLTSDERLEAARTFYVKRDGLAGALAANFTALCHRPSSYLHALMSALSMAGADLRKAPLYFFYLIEAAMVGRWMQSHRLNHLHVHFATPAATVGLLVTKLFPSTLSITVHGPDEFYDVTDYVLPQKISGAVLLCTIGMFARSQLMKLSPESEWRKMVVTPLGVDPELFQPRPFRPSPVPFEVLCVGRLVPAKGQHVLLSAIAQLRDQGRSILLRFVGDGPDRAPLEASARRFQLGDSVVFEGAVTQDRIRDFYGAADVFALASFAEGIPVVLMEAMAMEIPCVTTYIAGIPELIREGVDGLLVMPSDVNALAGAIGRLMDDAALRKRIGEAGRCRVIEKYNLVKNTEHLAEVFRTRLGAAA
jgi:glycosyltransferase involved in cell wall biosynthesis